MKFSKTLVYISETKNDTSIKLVRISGKSWTVNEDSWILKKNAYDDKMFLGVYI